MHWISILTALALSIVAAALVLLADWLPWQAFALTGGITLAVIAVALAMLLAIKPPRRWDQLIAEVLHTMREDAREIIDALRFRR